MKVTAFVTIRLNSQRLPGKNLLPLGGHALAWHICNTLLECETIDKSYIYCSDERVMEHLPQSPRLLFRRRDKWLDGNEVTAQDTYGAFTSEVESDIYVAALTTAPFITAASIDRGVKAMLEQGHDSAFSAKRLQTFVWYDGHPVNYNPAAIARTQDLKPLYMETSGFYAFSRTLWQQHRRRIGFNPYVVEVNHREAVDIDNLEDYKFAEMIVQNQNNQAL